MAEFSAKWTTNAAGSGDQVSGYTQAHYKMIYEILAATLGFEGVCLDYLNDLEGSVIGANTVEIGSGGALVDGHIYQNNAGASVNIPNASGAGNTRIDRIVLRCNWSAFTVRITRIAGVSAATPSAPAITQTSGTTYDILLYQALVNTSGAVTLTDERAFSSAAKTPTTKRIFFPVPPSPTATEPVNVAGLVLQNNLHAWIFGMIPEDYAGDGVVKPVVVCTLGSDTNVKYAKFDWTVWIGEDGGKSGAYEYSSSELAADRANDPGYEIQSLPGTSIPDAEAGDFIAVDINRDSSDPTDTSTYAWGVRGFVLEYTAN